MLEIKDNNFAGRGCGMSLEFKSSGVHELKEAR
jgi:hypothetical protein